MSVATQYTTAPKADETAAVARLVPAQSVIATRPGVPLSVLFLGVVAVLVAAWGAAAPFTGPEFGFVADRAAAWQWSVTSACLGLGPGAVAFLASLVVVAMTTRTSYARRADLWSLGLVVTLCGAWFVVGQYVWPVVYGARFIAPSTSTHFMWKELAFAIGPGVILVFCGAAFMGWAVRRQLALVADRYSRVAAPSASGIVLSDPAPATVVRPPRRAGPTEESAGTMAPPDNVRPVAEKVEPPVTDPAEVPMTSAAGDPPATETFEPPAGSDPPATETFEPPAGSDPPATETFEPPTGTDPLGPDES